jgi:hypothetical protein
MRKELTQAEVVPVYALFTNEQFAKQRHLRRQDQAQGQGLRWPARADHRSQLLR